MSRMTTKLQRKKQSAKLFKGRKKKPKWKGLNAKQEEKLLNVIANKSDTEDESILEEPLTPRMSDPKPFIISEKSFHTPKLP